ncbi:MAG: DUF4350 domain-containing protein [Planctomycetota bacterium]|jgi:hypothetical protein
MEIMRKKATPSGLSGRKNKSVLFCNGPGLNKHTLLWVALVCVLVHIQPTRAQQLDLADPAVRTAFVEQLAQRSQAEKEQAWAIAQSQGWAPKAEIDGVLFELMAIRNGRVYMNTTNNENAAISTATDLVRNTAPYNVDGTGETVGIWDGGSVLSTHQEFGARVSVMDGAASSYHSTHVGGTVGASGVVTAAMGMAPNVDIDSYNWTNDEAEMASRGMSFAGEPGTIQVSNHSYGTSAGWNWNYTPPRWYGTWGLGYREDELFGMYSDTTRWWDEICYNAPYYLPFKSAGNNRNDDAPSTGTTFAYYDGGWQTKSYDPATDPCDDGWDNGGYDTISHKGIAKNLMTVGAVDDAVLSGSRHLPSATMADFSGWGPTDDGRIKPDVVGNGVDLYSCDDDHNADYTSLDGTSMSTPNISGSAILLVEYYKMLFPGQYMRASTIKGLIIHTADDLGNPGPDYSFGWGLVDTQAAADVIAEQYDNPGTDIILEGLLNAANPDDSYTIDCNGSTPIRVTLCWTDPPASDSTALDDPAIKLINDLDLRIVGPGGSPTYYPYVLNPASPASNATTGDNVRDNVEQVYIDSPAAGTYTVQVSHKASLTDGEQHYSLILSGSGVMTGGVLVYFGQCGAAPDNVTPALANLGITNVTEVYTSADFESRLSSGSWELVIVDIYAGSLPGSSLDALVNYYDGGGKVICASWDLYSSHSAHPFVDRAGVTLAGDYTATEPIYAWIESPLFTTPNPVPDMTSYSNRCGRDGQYVQPVTASAHAGYTTSPAINEAAITVNAASRLILNAFAPQNFDQDQDTDGKIDMVELYENEINFLTGCLPPVPTNPSPPDGATGVPLDTDLSWNQALYGIRDSCDAAYAIDIYTGAPSFIGPSGVTGSTCGLAHSGGSVLYGSKPYGLTLIEVDGSGVEIRGSQGMEGMAYDPQTGTVYGSLNGSFFTINRTTGDVLTTLPNWPDDVEGLAFVPSVGTQGSVYGIDDDGELHRYDVALGTFTLVGNTGLAGASDNSGLAYAADLDVLFHVTRNAGNLYRIDKDTAVATLVANTGITGSTGFSGLAYGPAVGGGAAATATATKQGAEDSDDPLLTTDELGPVVIEVDVQHDSGRSSYGSLDLDIGSEAPMPEPSPPVTVDVQAFNDGQANIAAGQIDATTGETFQPAPHLDLAPLKTLSAGGAVLWDLTHGVYFNYEPSGRYSSLVSVLAGKGYTVDTTTAGVDNLDLSVYDVLVVSVGSAWYSAYTASEVTAIQTFVSNGGGLLVMGENTNTPNANINPVAQAYGVTCGVSYLTPDDLYFTNLAAHAVFAGCSQIYYRAAGELSAGSPGQLVAWADTGEGTVAVAESGAGRIVVTGDADFCANSNIGTADNQLFAESVFDWLSMRGGCYRFGGSSESYAGTNRMRGNVYTVSSSQVLSEIKMELDLSASGQYILTDEFDYWEDQSSHSYATTGEVSLGAYNCGLDDSLRVGSCSHGTGSARIVVSVIPGTDELKLRYKVPIVNSAGSALYVDGVYQGTIVSNGCDWEEKVVTGMSSYTADGAVEIEIADEVIGCDGDVQITYIEVYSLAADIDLYYYVLASATVDGSYTPIFEKMVTTAGVGRAFYSSGPIGVLLQPGIYYGIGIAWGSDTVTYYRDPATLPRSWALGTVEKTLQATGVTPPIVGPITPGTFAGAEYSMELCFGGCPTTYDVYLGTTPGSLGLICADTSAPICDPGLLACCRTYYWKVVAKNCCGQTAGPIWSFTTLGVGTCWDPAQCRGQPYGDATCDGTVNLADLFALKADFGKCAPWTSPECCADFTQDGCINLADLFALKAGFGSSGYSPSTLNQTCPP